jgi:hypothetical protein
LNSRLMLVDEGLVMPVRHQSTPTDEMLDELEKVHPLNSSDTDPQRYA